MFYLVGREKIRRAGLSLFLGLVLGLGAQEAVKKAVYYGATPIAEADADSKQCCVLDWYVPAKKEAKFATLVWFDEGEFSASARHIPEEFKTGDFAVASPGYRTTPNVKCKITIQDAAQALAYVMKNCEKLGGDSKKVFVGGSGTGGYLAALLVLDRSWLAACGIKDIAPAGLVTINGITTTHPAILKERGDYVPKRMIADELAPMRHVRRDAPPALFIVPDRRIEKTELYEANAYLWRMLNVSGNRTATVCEVQGYGHEDLPHFLPLVPRFIKQQCEGK